MTTQHEIEAAARAAVATGLYTILITDMLNRDEDVTDNAVWKPAQRAFLEAVIRTAQLRLAEENRPDDSEQRVHFPPDPDSLDRQESAQTKRLLDGMPKPVTEEGDYDREGTRRTECMGTAPHRMPGTSSTAACGALA